MQALMSACIYIHINISEKSLGLHISLPPVPAATEPTDYV